MSGDNLNHTELCELLHTFYYWDKGKAPLFLRRFIINNTDLQKLAPEHKRMADIAYGAFMLKGDTCLYANDDPTMYPLTSYGRAAIALYHIAKALESRGEVDAALLSITRAKKCLKQAKQLYKIGLDDKIANLHKQVNHTYLGAKAAQQKSAKQKTENTNNLNQRLREAVKQRISMGDLWTTCTTATAMHDRLWYEVSEAQKKGTAWNGTKLRDF